MDDKPDDADDQQPSKGNTPMSLISKKRILVPIAPALVIALAALSLPQAADNTNAGPPTLQPSKAPQQKKAPAITRTLCKPIVIRGKGKAKPDDLAALRTGETTDTPARKGRKIDFRKKTAPYRLTQTEKLALVKSVQPTLLKMNSRLRSPQLDLSWQPLTLDPRSPWVEGKGYLEFTGASTVLYDPPPSFASFPPGSNPGSVSLFFKTSQTGMYLITAYIGFGLSGQFTMQVSSNSGTIVGPVSSTFGATTEVFPIIYTVSDTTTPWQNLVIQPTAPLVLPTGTTIPPGAAFWYLTSIDIQFLPQMQ